MKWTIFASTYLIPHFPLKQQQKVLNQFLTRIPPICDFRKVDVLEDDGHGGWVAVQLRALDGQRRQGVEIAGGPHHLGQALVPRHATAGKAGLLAKVGG